MFDRSAAPRTRAQSPPSAALAIETQNAPVPPRLAPLASYRREGLRFASRVETVRANSNACIHI